MLVGFRAATLLAVFLLLGGATAASANSITSTLIFDQVDLLDAVNVEGGDGASGGPDISAHVTGVSGAAVMHDDSRIAFFTGNDSASGDRAVIEGITFDWDTGTAYGIFLAVDDANQTDEGGLIDIFDLEMTDDGGFALFWTEEAVRILNLELDIPESVVAGSQAGTAFLGADPHQTPEPGSLALLAVGAIGLHRFGRRKTL